MNKWISALLTLLLSSTATLVCAGQLASLSLIDQNTGSPLQIWRHQGRNYVAGNPGERYAVEVRNKTGARLLSVVSVDGVNVISGATAATGQTGYVLDAWRAHDIKGWRKNMDEVAVFYFTQLPDSYAARTGRPDHVGVIGVAVYPEYVEPIVLSEPARNYAAPTAAASGVMAKRADSAAAEVKLGTGHGERISSATRTTEFRRASSHAAEIISIYYDTHAHLVARGIIPRMRDRVPMPLPFPGNFVPDPS